MKETVMLWISLSPESDNYLLHIGTTTWDQGQRPWDSDWKR